MPMHQPGPRCRLRRRSTGTRRVFVEAVTRLSAFLRRRSVYLKRQASRFVRSSKHSSTRPRTSPATVAYYMPNIDLWCHNPHILMSNRRPPGIELRMDMGLHRLDHPLGPPRFRGPCLAPAGPEQSELVPFKCAGSRVSLMLAKTLIRVPSSVPSPSVSHWYGGRNRRGPLRMIAPLLTGTNVRLSPAAVGLPAGDEDRTPPQPSRRRTAQK